VRLQADIITLSQPGIPCFLYQKYKKLRCCP